VRFRSKPQEVEALQWTGDDPLGMQRFCGPNPDVGDPLIWRFYVDNGEGRLLAGVDGAQGWVPVPVGHWVVYPPGDRSDVWPVEDGYFRGKYEPADDGE